MISYAIFIILKIVVFVLHCASCLLRSIQPECKAMVKIVKCWETSLNQTSLLSFSLYITFEFIVNSEDVHTPQQIQLHSAIPKPSAENNVIILCNNGSEAWNRRDIIKITI